MSFSQETKSELARILPEKKCCQLAEIAGFIRVAGSLVLAGDGKFKIVVTTGDPAVARHYKKLIKSYFGIDAGLEIGEGERIGKTKAYSIVIDPEENSESILRETGVLLVREGRNYISDGIYFDIVKKKCDKKAFLRGAFLACGTIANPEKEYHMEFVTASEIMAGDLRWLIGSFDDLGAKVVKRKDKYVVYIKRSEYISDVLALMGAAPQVLAFENTRVEKDVVSRAVRVTNCDSANTDRTITASGAQVTAIKNLLETGRMNDLSDKLKEVAELRIANPEASLTELGEMLDPPLTKAGVNGRMKRIMKLASGTT